MKLIWILLFLILVYKKIHIINQNLKYKIISQLGPDKHSSAGDNIGNPDDPRRTQSDFQRVGIALSCTDNLMFETCYLMISLDPKSYYHARNDPIWQAAMDEEMNSL